MPKTLARSLHFSKTNNNCNEDLKNEQLAPLVKSGEYDFKLGEIVQVLVHRCLWCAFVFIFYCCASVN